MRLARIAALAAVLAAVPVALATAAPSAQPAQAAPGGTLPPFEFESPLRNPLQHEFLAPQGDPKAAPPAAPGGSPLATPRRSTPISAAPGAPAGQVPAGPPSPVPGVAAPSAYGPATARLTGRHTVLCPGNPQTEAAIRDIIPVPANILNNPEGVLNVQGPPIEGRPAVNILIPPGSGCLMVLQDVR